LQARRKKLRAQSQTLKINNLERINEHYGKGHPKGELQPQRDGSVWRIRSGCACGDLYDCKYLLKINIMELTGRVVRLLPLKEGVSQAGNPYRTQDFIFGFYEHQSDIYERNIILNIRNENIEKYKLAENDQIKVRVALSCREYPQGSGKYFNEIRTGDITIIEKFGKEPQNAPAGGGSEQKPTDSPAQAQNAATGQANGEGGENDLPF
jgi:hypothetical protein